ncbi:pyruvate kinase [Persicirhabdus sediminis]|uniref:Pyruvate kinase n=1 Tax=Persicirhabdus sediminis TaxID=454144 RepID=A0A8J7MCZ6_9BACT|nr:pyruvate kinase [Persicirhabdus sediminis]MBK1791469.1 pyruvate kinase [Persicirhabdus sediminis]
MSQKTRIISTLGPVSDSNEMLGQLIDAGVNIFRLNMSHAPREWVKDVTLRIRAIAKEKKRHTAVLCDLQGPSIRTGDLDEPYMLVPGDVLEFRKRDAEQKEKYSSTVNYEGLMDDVRAGDPLVVDNGYLLMTITEVLPDRIVCEVKTEGKLGSRRHINLPGVRLNLPALTAKDHGDLATAVEAGVDFIAGSFVRDAAHVDELRKAMEELGGEAHIVAKIEDQEAIRNIDGIINAADGIMVARGDLGVEVEFEELPLIQRRIVRRCHVLGRRVIVATQMLESMIENPMPTRAEVTDVANAVFEEADAIMLSGETAMGRYPVQCVETLSRIAQRIERSGGMGYGKEVILRTERQKTLRAAVNLVDSIADAQIICFTRRGFLPVACAQLRPQSRIHAFTSKSGICRKMALSRGVRAYQIPFSEDHDTNQAAALEVLRGTGEVPEGTPLIVISDTLQKDHTVDSILIIHA